MDKIFIEMNILETITQLQEIVSNLKNNDYDVVEFEVEMGHAYGHMNSAFNSRGKEKIVIENENFEEIRKMPTDINL